MQALQQAAIARPVAKSAGGQGTQEEKSLMDRIQEDFPRTPSPIFSDPASNPSTGPSPPAQPHSSALATPQTPTSTQSQHSSAHQSPSPQQSPQPQSPQPSQQAHHQSPDQQPAQPHTMHQDIPIHYGHAMHPSFSDAQPMHMYGLPAQQMPWQHDRIMTVPPPGMGVINVNGCPHLVPLGTMLTSAQQHYHGHYEAQHPGPMTTNADLQRQVVELQRQVQMQLQFSMQQQQQQQQQQQEVHPALNDSMERSSRPNNKNRTNRKTNGGQREDHGERVQVNAKSRETKARSGKGSKRGKQRGQGSRGGQEEAGILGMLRTEMRPGGQGSSVLELSRIQKQVLQLSRDQYGSRFIQHKLENNASTQDKYMVFEEVLSQTIALSKDVFGNYVIQKLLQHGDPNIVEQLVQQLLPETLDLALHMYGCRVVQRAVELCNDNSRGLVLGQLETHEPRLLRDANGNHVLQKCIEKDPNSAVSLKVLKIFADDTLRFAQDEYGCRILQRMLEHCTHQQVEPLLSCVLENVVLLSKNQYGNYVIQHLLVHGDTGTHEIMSEQICGKVLDMSLHKFASNVMEKALSLPELCPRLVDEVVERHLQLETETSQNLLDSPLIVMMKDQYGNYVVQKMIEHSAAAHRESLLKCVTQAAAQLRTGSYSKHILNRVEKLIAP
eukprot:TRINITY_DN6618_c0_g1_i3.p1 TRINITY_DN6618_c0_g1~~TRINITY_DN6618_c0_g1_i3.p1  ORF type:complete len:666 (-),score=132.92 TRINITY_DN6618_c0_g1_i3:499-2496(-)